MRWNSNKVLIALWVLIALATARVAERVETIILTPANIQKELLSRQVAGFRELKEIKISGFNDLTIEWFYEISPKIAHRFRRNCSSDIRNTLSPDRNISDRVAMDTEECFFASNRPSGTRYEVSISVKGNIFHIISTTGPGPIPDKLK